MDPDKFAAIASVIVIVVTVIGQWINSRNDRTLANQELDILAKLALSSGDASQLHEVIRFRIAKWHQRWCHPGGTCGVQSAGSSLLTWWPLGDSNRSTHRRANPAPAGLRRQ
jgi:hypothetical protein